MEKRKYWRPEDLEITHTRGSGPGGQNRNKRMTGVRIQHLPTGIVAEATERRSQAQNLGAAYERLEEKLQLLFHRDKPRVATKVSRTQKKRRVENKRIRSATKRFRRKPYEGE